VIRQMTGPVRPFTDAMRRHARTALTLLAFAAGIARGPGLYIGIDGFYVTVTAVGPDVQSLNGYPGMHPQAVQIPVASLKGPLAQDFGTSGSASAGTITGYEFRNARNKPAPVCLGAVDTGRGAGLGDPVRALSCSSLPNEIWIPVQWEKKTKNLPG
jgi:hypothetical protein